MKTIAKKINNYRTEKIIGVKVDFISCPQVLSLVDYWVNTNKQYQITTPNPEHIVLSQSDYRFKNIINKSALSLADGVGLVWAVKLLSSGIAQFIARSSTQNKFCYSNFNRLSGTDLMLALCKLSTQKNWRIFLLGGKNNAAQKAAAALNNSAMKQCNNKLNIQFYEGPQNISKLKKSENETLINKINNFKPHLLFVAFGAPMQEKWIAKNLLKLKVKVAMGVGGSFDYLAGIVKRAPQWVRKAGLEWLWRLVHEPWRWRRQLRLIKFVYLVMKERFR